MTRPFWKRKKLAEMSREEWESLCDGCGRCCLVKLEDEDTGEILTTSVVCALYDTGRGECSDYANRHAHMPDCISLTPENVGTITWLPATCAYRLLHEGKDLPPWHPLRSGDPDTVREAGISILDEVISEAGVETEDLPAYIREWPDMGPPQIPAEREKEGGRKK